MFGTGTAGSSNHRYNLGFQRCRDVKRNHWKTDYLLRVVGYLLGVEDGGVRGDGEIARVRHLVVLLYVDLGTEYFFAWVQEWSLVVTGLWFELVGSA